MGPTAAAVALSLALLVFGCRGEGTSADPRPSAETSADTETAPSPAPWYDVVLHEPGPEVTDEVMREKIRDSGLPWKVRDRATGIEMVLVMPGEFLMGSPTSETGRNANEGPRHRVKLTRAYYLGATEVTQAQWRRVMGERRGFFEGDERPADGSWHDLQAFLKRANAAAPAGTRPLRAPTEAEWEYACRAGTAGPFHFERPTNDLANFNDGVADRSSANGGARAVNGRIEVAWETPPSPGTRLSTAVAGSLPANPWGLYEMHGNVGEWTSDRYSADAYAGRGELTVDPADPAGDAEAHTLRGGDWYKRARYGRAAARDQAAPHARSNRIGFRVARTP